MNTPGFFAIDDITYNITAVNPEPSSLVLAAAGLAAVAAAAVRRRRG